MCCCYLCCSCSSLCYVSPSFRLIWISSSYLWLLQTKRNVTFTYWVYFQILIQYIFILFEFMTYFTCCGTLVCGWLKLFVRFWVCSTTFPVSNLACPLLEGAFGFSALDLSSLPAHPEEPVGTIAIVGSFPWCSAFKLGRLAGARRAVGIFPRLWSPCFCGMVFCWGFVAEP